MIPDGRFSRIRFEAAAFSRAPSPGLVGLSRSPHPPTLTRVYAQSSCLRLLRAYPSNPLGPRSFKAALRTQRPFASRDLPLPHRYYGLMCQSWCLSPTMLLARWRVLAAWTTHCRSPGPSRRYLCESFPGCLDPYPGGSCGALARFFPQDFGLPHVSNRSALSHTLYSDFCTGLNFGAAVIP